MRSQTSQRMMQTSLALVLMVALHLSARADTITFPTGDPGDPFTFNFNSLADGANNTAVQNYMNGFLTPFGASVAVSGAKAENGYDGDGHVVGPCNGGGTACASMTPKLVTPLTLGTSDYVQVGGAPRAGANTDFMDGANANLDTFIINKDGVDRFSFTFSNLPAALFPGGVTHLGFDFEIFPDDQCADSNELSNLNNCNDDEFPDFSFYADDGTGDLWDLDSKVFHFWGFQPSDLCTDNGRNAAFNAGQPAGQVLVCSPYTDSNVTDGTSSLTNDERVPQLIGSVFIVLDTPATRFGFRDWPRRIGIDNFYMPTSQTPEPGTLILLGTGLLAVGRKLRKRQNRKQDAA
jgi:hypothetical protein